MSGIFDRAHLVINRSILPRVFQDCLSNPSVEIGGRWFGWYVPAEERWAFDKEHGTGNLGSGDLHYVLDYIPTGPNPESKTSVELQPDREYQLWAFNELQRIDASIEILGTWHSHIPNGLTEFSRFDWDSYHSKLQTYPFPRMLCSLIHTAAESFDDVENHLHHAWFPRDAELGVHTWVEPLSIHWVEVEVPGGDFLDLEDFSVYLSTLEKPEPLEVVDWYRAAAHVANIHGGRTHELKQHPNGTMWLLLEKSSIHEVGLMVNVDGSASVTVRSSGSILSEQSYPSIDFAVWEFQNALKVLGMNAVTWSHLNASLAQTLRSNIDLEASREELKIKLQKAEEMIKKVEERNQEIRARKQSKLAKVWGSLGGRTNAQKRAESENKRMRTGVSNLLKRLDSNLPEKLSHQGLQILLENDFIELEDCKEMDHEKLAALGLNSRDISLLLD